jgi:hypothetical protein
MDLTKKDLIFVITFGLYTKFMKLSVNTNAGRFKFPLSVAVDKKARSGQ